VPWLPVLCAIAHHAHGSPRYGIRGEEGGLTLDVALGVSRT